MKNSITIRHHRYWWMAAIIVISAANTKAQTETTAPNSIQPARIQPSSFGPEGIPVFTNESIPPQQRTNPPAPETVFLKLQQTCHFWSEKYRQRRSELARLNMNSACKEASDFARRRLNKKVTARYAPFRAGLKHKNPSATVSFNGRQDDQLVEKCKTWKKRITVINRQLRAGYKESRGNRLRQQRRDLSDRIFKSC